MNDRIKAAAMGETTDRAWMRLPSGRRLDLLSPDPEDWDDHDLAVRLSRTYRWGGESTWPLPLSVAQHSLTVLAMVEGLQDVPLSPATALRELLHDAEEGFLGFDCISPLKRALGRPFADVSARLMLAIEQRYALPAWSDTEYQIHKTADLLSAVSEAFHCVGWSLPEIKNVLCLGVVPAAVDPLVAIYNCEPWEPWPADVAARRFLTKLHELAGTAS